MIKAVYAVAAALMLGGCFAVAAQNAPASAQEPPPVADKGTTSQINCVVENDEHRGEGHRQFFRIAMSNNCEQRIKCRVFAASYSSKGPSFGRATLVLAPKSKSVAPQIYDFKVKGAGGMTSTSRECRVF